ncbi:MAG: c-type cytochrome [Chloroflexota bacterium]|jgi:mono/diheme cytochrome c family protein
MKIAKRVGLGLGGLIILLVLVVFALNLVGTSRLQNGPDVTVQAVPLPTDAEALARGEHLSRILGCVSCHGSDLSGQLFMEDPDINAYLPAPNLTVGQGGIGSSYTDADWARALRHGIGGDGRTLAGMPSNYYTNLSDDDLGDVIVYVQSAPPVDNDLGPRQVSFPASLIFGVLAYNDLPVTKIDHDNVGSVKPAEGPTAEYGAYLASITACGDCHGANLEGRPPEAAEQGPPAGPNLTPGGRLSGWTADEFAAALRQGETPDGQQLNEEMPWPYYSVMSDDEVQAIWLYLQSLPAQ